MTRNQKIVIISVGSALIGAYLSIFIYQRIKRAKADASVISEDEALKILNDKSPTLPPAFSEEDLTPKLPSDEIVDNIESDTPSDLLMDFEIQTGLGDY
jgi:hypothetical protein